MFITAFRLITAVPNIQYSVAGQASHDSVDIENNHQVYVDLILNVKLKCNEKPVKMGARSDEVYLKLSLLFHHRTANFYLITAWPIANSCGQEYGD